MAQIKKDYSFLQSEYSQVCEMLRHYSSLRFAVFTVFFAVTGGLISITSKQTSVLMQTKLNILSVISVVVFWFFEERIIATSQNYVNRGTEIESKLGYKAIATRPGYSFLPFLRTSFATRLIYAAVMLFWLSFFFGY